MGEGGLGNITERAKRQENRRQQDRLRHRHVVAEVQDGASVGNAIPKALNDDVHPEPLGLRD